VSDHRGRYWEVLAPVRIEETVAGAVAVKFSFDRADALAARTRNWALVLTAASVAVMGALMTLAVHLVVNRPIQRFLEAIRRVQQGDQSAVVRVATNDEFGVLANHFNAMMARLRTFNEELQGRVTEATARADERYREVERLHGALFRMQRNLSHAERLALAGQIMAEVAHEVGAPLQSVAGHVQLLRKDLPPEVLREPVTRHFGIIQSQLARVTEIITQLLGLTRRHPGEPVPVDLNRLVRETAELMRPSLAVAGVTLEITPTRSIPGVRGHPSRLQQVVLNLFTNAMDATAPGGTIRVATRSVADDTCVELEVADSGRGIPAKDLKHIFEPFFSTKEPAHGTGLGLFISAQIVREHRGRIDVASEEDRGSTFAVRLPVDGAVA
jgi:signal transduction histidine kinase